MEAWILILMFALVLTGAGFVQSCIGFGYAVVAMSILPYFMDVRLANLALSISVIFPTVLAVRSYRHDLDWNSLAWSFVGAALLLPIGLLAFAYLSADVLVRGTGVVILMIAIRELRPYAVPSSTGNRRIAIAGAGAVSGFLTGAVGIGGPPIAAYAIRLPWSPARFKAFVLAFLLLLSAAKVMGVLAAGWVDQTVLVYSAVAVPFAMVGTQLGIVASRRFSPQRFRRAVIFTLIAISLGMALRGGGSTAPDLSASSSSATGKLRPTAISRASESSSTSASGFRGSKKWKKPQLAIAKLLDTNSSFDKLYFAHRNKGYK